MYIGIERKRELNLAFERYATVRIELEFEGEGPGIGKTMKMSF